MSRGLITGRSELWGARVIGEWKPDVVVHLASIVTPAPGQGEAFANCVDVDGTRNLLDACISHGVRRVVATSSGAGL